MFDTYLAPKRPAVKRFHPSSLPSEAKLREWLREAIAANATEWARECLDDILRLRQWQRDEAARRDRYEGWGPHNLERFANPGSWF